MREKHVYISVTNDLSTDQRADRTARFFHDSGYRVTLIGRVLPSRAVTVRAAYGIRRFRLLFSKGPLFYICYNFRLFAYLLFRPAVVLVANDLDTLPANFLVSLIKRRPLVYDSHELFTEVPELEGRKLVRSFWLLLERIMLPRIKYAVTVSESIASVYMERYGISMRVVRNLPDRISREYIEKHKHPASPPRIIYQGALNAGRGLEQVVRAMGYLDNCQLHLVGDGDIRQELQAMVSRLKLEDRVIFHGHKPFEELLQYTLTASLGISTEEQKGLNYYYALPNKLFNYIQARLPVLVSAFPEMCGIVQSYGIGLCLEHHQPRYIARIIAGMIGDRDRRARWLQNLEAAAEQLCWENEKPKLAELLGEVERGKIRKDPPPAI